MSKHRQTGRAPATRRARLTGLVALSGCLCLLVAACSGGLRQSADEGSSGGGSGCDRSASYPSGPVEMVVPWDAGGGTDSVARFVGAQLAKSLDTQVNVVNRTGGSGAVGHSAIAGAPPDGSTIGMATVEITMMHWQGLTELNHEQLTPIAQVNSDPAGITVRADAPWDDAKSLIEDARKNPGSLTASGTGVAGIWDLARAGMLMESGVDTDAIRWVPSDGAAPALQELVAGGIDVSFASLAENQTMLRSGRVKALGVMGDKPDPLFPDVPTLKEQGIDFEMSAWRGIAGPSGLPEDVAAELTCNLDEIVHGKAYQRFMERSGFGIEWRDAEEFGSFMAEQDRSKGKIMDAAGLTQ